MLRVGRHPVRVDELDAGEPYRLDAVVNLGHGLVVLLGGDRDLQQTVFSLYWSLKRRSIRRFLITEKALVGALSVIVQLRRLIVHSTNKD